MFQPPQIFINIFSSLKKSYQQKKGKSILFWSIFNSIILFVRGVHISIIDHNSKDFLLVIEKHSLQLLFKKNVICYKNAEH